MKVKSLSRVRLLATPWTAAYQAPPSMGFSRQQYWSRVPLPSPLLRVMEDKCMLGFHGCSDGKESACNAGDSGSISGSGRSLGEGNGNPLQYIVGGRIPWTEQPGRLQFMGSQRVGHY